MPRNANRLTAVDLSFLACEDRATHMHIAAIATFDGPAPRYEDFVNAIGLRLRLLPRFRQRLAIVPLDRPVWIDDPSFNLNYHVRHTSLPSPGNRELCALTARICSQQIDRSKPLWEMWLIQGMEDGRFALILKVHHALLDGVALVNVAIVLFSDIPVSVPSEPLRPWPPGPPPTTPQLFLEALKEQATVPAAAIGTLGSIARKPRSTISSVWSGTAGLTSALSARLKRAPTSRLNAQNGPHRRFVMVERDFNEIVKIKRQYGATVNDVALTAVSLAQGHYQRLCGYPTDGVVLQALVPRSVRTPDENHQLGNRIAGMVAPLPIDVTDPGDALLLVRDTMTRLKRSRQSSGVRLISTLGEYVPPMLVSGAARLAAHRRPANLVVTNVPGPESPLFLMGRQMRDFCFVPPLSGGHALSVGVTSYDGKFAFGLLADYDSYPDVDSFAASLTHSIDEMACVASRRATHLNLAGSRSSAQTSYASSRSPKSRSHHLA